MAKLDRKDVKIFAENSKETLITEFRTEDSEGNTASFSRDPDVIQNGNYSQGWVNDTNNLNTKIYGEDLNAVNYVLSYLLKYLYENGIAEWKSTTTYYTNSIVKVGDKLYRSLQDNNTNNNPENTVSYWDLIPLENVSIDNSGTGFSVVKNVTGNTITFKTISVTGYGEITDNGDQLNIDIAGGGGGGSGDAYWGTIRGTITNQTDLISLINLKQDIFTVDSPLVLTDEQHLTINKATSSVSGYLDYQDWNTFNGKQNSLSFSTPLSETSGTVSISKADTSTSGYLDYQDWNTFNGKQDNIQGVDFYYDNSIIKQEPDSDRTSYMGSTTHPYNYVYTGQIGDSTHPVTDTYSTNLTSTNATVTNATVTNTTVTNATVTNITSDNYKNNINYTNPQTIFTDFNFGSTYEYSSSSSSNTEMPILNITSCYDSYLNTQTEILPQKTSNPNAKVHNCNLGSSTSSFSHTYTTDIHTNNIYVLSGSTMYLQSNLRDSGGGVHNLGSNDNYFAGVYAGGFVTRPSDIREKENIESYKNSVLDKLDKLNPMTYTVKGDDEKKVRFGLSAQELKEIEPLCVIGEEKEPKKDGTGGEYLGIELYSLCTLSIQAIKELNDKVKTLEARIEELEGNKEELKK